MREHTIGPLLRELRQLAGRSQQEQADELNVITGRSTDRHQVSDWERGVIPGPYWQQHMAASFGVPVELLRKACTAARQERRLMKLSLAGDVTEDPVKRRSVLGAIAVAAGAASEPWGRLAFALGGGSVDATTVRQLTAATASLYTDEEHTPARVLAARITAHLDAVTALIPHAGQYRAELVITAGETAALAGWAAWDRGDTDVAGHYYRTVRDAAHEVGHPAVEALALAYASYGAAPAKASAMLAAAQEKVIGPGYATAYAWTAAREAEERAKLGAETEAVRALDRARTAYQYARPEAEQAWVAFCRPSRLDSMAVSTYTKLGHREAVAQAHASLRHLDDGNPKINVAVLTDAAMAFLGTSDDERGFDAARRALETTDACGYAGVTMINARLRDVAGALPDSAAARSLREDIRAALA